MFTTKGSVRGSCGHDHRTLKGAVACLKRDQRGCAKQGGYSDRTVLLSTGEGLPRELWEEYDNLVDG